MSQGCDRWIADRMRHIEASGIRKVFELTKTLKDPVNLSIGQPHFDVPEPIKAAAKDAIDRGANGYTVTQGIPPLRQKIHETIRQRFPHPDREVVVTSGSSGGLMLALCCAANPADEEILFDPSFFSYPPLFPLAGGKPLIGGTLPSFLP